MEQIIDLLRETIRRNEDLAKELGATRVECTNWRNKYYDNLADTDLVEQRTEKNIV